VIKPPEEPELLFIVRAPVLENALPSSSGSLSQESVGGKKGQ